MAADQADILGRAYAAESRLAARLEAMAAKAGQEQRPGLARLFAALALSHQARARRYLMLLRGKIGTSAENWAEIKGRELPGLLDDLLGLGRQATDDGPAAKALEQAARVAGGVLERLRAMKEDEPGATWLVCQVCGHVASGEPPERCPVCGAVASRFTRLI